MSGDSFEKTNASGCKDPTPREAMEAMKREEWRALCRCVREMIDVANKHNMRVDGLIPLTGRRTGVCNHDDLRGGVAR